jgi:hypothetical protein
LLLPEVGGVSDSKNGCRCASLLDPTTPSAALSSCLFPEKPTFYNFKVEKNDLIDKHNFLVAYSKLNML